MRILDDTTSGTSEHPWDTHPKAGWEEFTAARNRLFERLQFQSDLTRMMLDSEPGSQAERAVRVTR